MPYHAIENMQQQNKERFNLPDDVVRPLIPELKPSKYYDYPALLFIRDSCTDLRFKDAIEKCKTDEEKDRVRAYRDNRGKSTTKNQIPALMEKDLDRMCLERALADFLAQGTDSSAFTVYYCYLEMFWNTGAANHRKLENMLKLLSQFEHSASPLLRSHRDHFVHCVYVFSIGLAIYQQSKLFRGAYETYYGLNGEKAAHHFLKYWGFTALFHDLGYPFELVYEQINSCFETEASGGAGFYLSYQDKQKRSGFNARFASELTDRLYDKFRCCPNYKSYLKGKADTKEQYSQYLKKALDRKPSDPHSFGDHMDHAYFSAYLLLHRLWPRSQWNSIKKDDWDALTAIMLHNSLFKHTILLHAPSIGSYPRMEMSTHPLAFLLMLCDELQCWNRFGYGRKTRQENHPFDCVLTVENDTISATYLFDKERIDDCSGTYKKFCGSDDPCKFVSDLEYILMVNCDQGLQLEFDTEFDDLPEYSKEPLSHSSFIDTYQLAAILHSEYITRPKYTPLRKKRPFDPEKIEEEQRIKYFDELSLEYKLANICQVQRFVKHLDHFHLFFTDRRVAFPEVKAFEPKQLEEIGCAEHELWSDWKRSMGWTYGTRYNDTGMQPIEKRNLRERLREHEYIDVSFYDISDDIRQKDIDPIEKIAVLIKKKYNIRIYRLIDAEGSNPD